MNAVRVLLVAGLLACGAPAVAQDGTQRAAQAPQASLAGEYHLDGVMETGSGLLLRQDGTFEWYFTYGALDLAARGRWRYEGADVVLDVEEFLAPAGHEAMKFEKLKLRADGMDLVPAWPWDGGAERGRYTRE